MRIIALFKNAVVATVSLTAMIGLLVLLTACDAYDGLGRLFHRNPLATS
jgi:hypothetical protein